MKALVDLDGTIVDFNQGAMKLHGKPWPYDNPANRGTAGWDVYKLWNMTPAEFWHGMDRTFWATLEPYSWAFQLIELAIQSVGQSNVAFVTSPAHTAGCVEGKIDWVEKHFSYIPTIMTRSKKGGSPPKHFLAHRDAVLIDDYEQNVKEFYSAGGEAILFPRPWNSLERLADDPMSYVKRELGRLTGKLAA